MRATLVALGEALVDAVAVGMVGDDEDAGLGERGSCGTKECTGQKRREGSHVAPINEGGSPHSDRPNWLRMINHASDAASGGGKRLFRGLLTL